MADDRAGCGGASRRRRPSIILLFAAAAAPLLFSRLESRPADLRAFLPADNEVAGWRASGPPQEFKGEDLYLYIDGGAEIYREYGFIQVVVQDYKNASGKGLSVEIFEMSDPAAACGMYTFKKSGKGRPLEAGVEGQAEDYYLNFWSGNILVTITAYDRDAESRQGLLQAAAAASRKIPRAGERPWLIAALPRPGLEPSSVRYFRGYLGFMNFYSGPGKEEFRAGEGVRGEYSFGAVLTVLSYRDEKESAARFDAVASAVRAARPGDFKVLTGVAFQALDGKGLCVTVRAAGPRLLVCTAAPGSAGAARLLEEAAKGF